MGAKSVFEQIRQLGRLIPEVGRKESDMWLSGKLEPAISHMQLRNQLKTRAKQILDGGNWDDRFTNELKWCAGKVPKGKWTDQECFDIFWGSASNPAAPVPGYVETINNLPTENQIELDPILYTNDEYPKFIRDYAKKLISGN